MIHIEGLRHHLLEIPSLTIAGPKVALIGRNGAGKTSLLELLAGIDRPKEGSITVDGEEPRTLRVGWVGEFPDHTILFSRVFDEVCSSLRFTYVPVAEAERMARETMRSLGALHLWDRATAELSGGEKALVAYAAAVVNPPRLLILDEVDSHLDERCASLISDSILHSGFQTVFCTQDMDLAAKADEVLFLDNGRVVQHGPPQEVFHALEGSCFYPNSWRMGP
ncbi:MAG: energy-coupling factor ABC transporter ATP-binding protein [Candidatus Methanomethylophilaceae archaeon]|mgnify:CR=1 FL=1|nr:energy-coupling factor ABC transporter ATP-binding protein [Candidatus Methanomethylophilaceae archaeon]